MPCKGMVGPDAVKKADPLTPQGSLEGGANRALKSALVVGRNSKRAPRSRGRSAKPRVSAKSSPRRTGYRSSLSAIHEGHPLGGTGYEGTVQNGTGDVGHRRVRARWRRHRT